MKTCLNCCRILWAALFIFAPFLIAARAAASDAVSKKPNIVFILVDDYGKNIGCYGGKEKTPVLDALAETGMRFTNYYSMPQCTPTRASFLTGQYPFRNGWVNHFDVPRWNLFGFDPSCNPSIGNVMKSAGYATCIAGKWQISDFRREPNILSQCGFDEYCVWTGFETGTPASDKRYWDPYLHTAEGSKTYPGEYGPDICNRFIRDFIERHKSEPMFIYYPMILCHAPMEDRPIDVSPIGYVDTLVGNVVQALERAGIRENTILVWTTDNGPQKGKATEDGACVPLIVNGPGLVPSGVVSDALVDITDMLPTFAALGGASPPARYVYDGQSMADLFTGKAQDSPRQWIMAMGGGAGAASTDPAQPPSAPKNKTVYRDRAIRDKQFKLYIGQDRKPEKMIDLLADPNEKNNILDSVASGIHSDPAAQAALEKFLAVEAGFPAQDANPHCAAAE